MEVWGWLCGVCIWGRVGNNFKKKEKMKVINVCEWINVELVKKNFMLKIMNCVYFVNSIFMILFFVFSF